MDGVTDSRSREVRPLVVIASGAVVDLLAMNERAYVKTIESRSLWVTDAGGARELPYRPPKGGTSRIADLRRGDSWYAAALADRAATKPPQGDGAGPGPLLTEGEPDVLHALAATIRERKGADPARSYTAYLFEQGAGKIRKKVGEEAIEVITAGTAEELVTESADLLYHLLALLEAQGVRLDQVYAEIERRRR